MTGPGLRSLFLEIWMFYFCWSRLRGRKSIGQKSFDKYPSWFNRFAHGLLCCIVGSALGIYTCSLIRGKPLSEFDGHALGVITGATAIYILAGTAVLFQKNKKRT